MKNFNFKRKKEVLLNEKIQIKKRTFIIMTLSFLILNFFIASFLNVQWMKKEIKSNYFFTADFQDGVSRNEKGRTEIEVLKLDGVKKVRYVSKEEAFQKLQHELDISIPRSENPLSDSMIIYFQNPKDLEEIQKNVENFQTIKESFSDGTYISYKEKEYDFYSVLGWIIFLFGIVLMMIIIYFSYYTSITIDYINNVEIIKNDNANRKRAKKINILPTIASNIIGTLAFFSVYNYFRKNLILISSKYLILSAKEIIFMQLLILIVINIVLLLIPIRIKLIKEEES